MDLQKLSQEAFETAKAHGWHDMERPDETHLMLIITEIAEAVQADRIRFHANVDDFKSETDGLTSEYDDIWKYDFKCYIKNSVEDELADIIIRCLDFAALRITPLRSKIAGVIAYTLAWCSYNGIDIGFFVEQKMKYNRLREYKHGNKKY